MNDYSEMKKCVICNKEYKPYAGQETRQKTCSPECRRKYKAMYSNEYKKREYVKRASRIRMRKAIEGRTKCSICGKSIYRNWELGASTKTMHDECVFADAAETLRAGNELSNVQIQRLYARGYTLKEFREETRERD